MLMLRRTHRKIFQEQETYWRDQISLMAREAQERLTKELADQQARFESRLTDPEAKARWASPDGKKVLHDLQEALNLIRAYQTNLSSLAAADPQYKEADELLKRWGMEGDPDKIVMGFQSSKKPPRTIIVSTDEEEYQRRGGRRTLLS